MLKFANPYNEVFHLRKHSKDLFLSGKLDVLYADDGVFVFTRSLNKELALVAINTSEEHCDLQLKMEPNLLLSEQLGLGTLLSDGNGFVSMSLRRFSSNLYLKAVP